jgi:hypothetical protein
VIIEPSDRRARIRPEPYHFIAMASACRTCVLTAFLFAAMAASAQLGIEIERTGFGKGDIVQTTKPTALYFNNTLARQCAKGEVFQVAAYKSETRRIFLNATDNTGRLIALNADATAFARIDDPRRFFLDEIIARCRSRDYHGAAYLAQRSRDLKINDPQLAPIVAVCLSLQKNLDELDRQEKAKASAKKRIESLRWENSLDTAADKAKKDEEATRLSAETDRAYTAAKMALDRAAAALEPLIQDKEKEKEAAKARAEEDDGDFFKGRNLWTIVGGGVLALIVAAYYLTKKIRS